MADHNPGIEGRDEDQELLERYIPLVKFLSQQFPDTEFVLHDVRRLESSIVAIGNQHISGRKVGDPATDLVLQIIQGKEYEQQNFTPVYTSVSERGNFLNSGTYYIMNNDRLIGLLCVNTDLTALHGMAKAVEDLFASRGQKKHGNGSPPSKEQFYEKLRHSVTDIPVETTLQVIQEKDMNPDHMTQDDRIEVISELNRRGIFLLKGAIPIVAKALKISEATIYRYIRQLR